MNRIELFSPLPPSACVARLAAAVDHERSPFFSLAGLLGSKPVAGRVTESSLRLRRRIRYRNSFQTFLTATMRPDGHGTTISGELGMHALARVWMTIWFIGVVFMGGALFVATVVGAHTGPPRAGESRWLGLAILPMMLGFGVALVRVGRWLARKEARFLIDFLLETLEARETTGPSPTRER